jgi:hypothetical protein
MSASVAALVRTFRVGPRMVTWTIPQPTPGSVSHSVVEWEPDMPKRLSEAEWRQYREGRDAIYAELSAVLGIRIAVMEL